MCAISFGIHASGSSMKNAFNNIRRSVIEMGERSGVCAKESFTPVNIPAEDIAVVNEDYTNKLLLDKLELNDRWGPAGGIALGGGDYFFFGMAADDGSNFFFLGTESDAEPVTELSDAVDAIYEHFLLSGGGLSVEDENDRETWQDNLRDTIVAGAADIDYTDDIEYWCKMIDEAEDGGVSLFLDEDED